MSWSGRRAATRAPVVEPSAKLRRICVAPSTTCSAVRMAPAALMTTPVPSVSCAPGCTVITVTSDGVMVW